MTGKEKGVEMKHDSAGRKKHASKHVDHTVPGTEDQETQQVHETENQEALKLSEELSTLNEKLKELQDKYLRLSAEFDNYRKRTLKEKSEMIRNASEDLIVKIIPFVDDIERGLNAVNTSQDLEAVKLGMNLIYSRFNDFLQQNGVKEIEALNQDFNTDFHEAVTKVQTSDENQKGKVVDIIVKGYQLYDKVIRYPKVVVGE